jgi:hypothetical protein
MAAWTLPIKNIPAPSKRIEANPGAPENGTLWVNSVPLRVIVVESSFIAGKTRTSNVKQNPANSGAAIPPAESIARRNPGSSGVQTS